MRPRSLAPALAPALASALQACAAAPPPRAAAPPAVPLLALLDVAGPGARDDDEARACSREDEAFGPPTLAHRLSPSGPWFHCRTGPSPRGVMLELLHADAAARACVAGAGVRELEARVEVSARGGVARVTATRVDPPTLDARRCLALLARHRVRGPGCRFVVAFRWWAME